MHSITSLPILCILCADMTMSVHLQDGAVALFIASQIGHSEIVQRLIEAGASLDVRRNVSYCSNRVQVSICLLS